MRKLLGIALGVIMGVSICGNALGMPVPSSNNWSNYIPDLDENPTKKYIDSTKVSSVAQIAISPTPVVNAEEVTVEATNTNSAADYEIGEYDYCVVEHIYYDDTDEMRRGFGISKIYKSSSDGKLYFTWKAEDDVKAYVTFLCFKNAGKAAINSQFASISDQTGQKTDLENSLSDIEDLKDDVEDLKDKIGDLEDLIDNLPTGSSKDIASGSVVAMLKYSCDGYSGSISADVVSSECSIKGGYLYCGNKAIYKLSSGQYSCYSGYTPFSYQDLGDYVILTAGTTSNLIYNYAYALLVHK